MKKFFFPLISITILIISCCKNDVLKEKWVNTPEEPYLDVTEIAEFCIIDSVYIEDSFMAISVLKPDAMKRLKEYNTTMLKNYSHEEHFMLTISYLGEPNLQVILWPAVMSFLPKGTSVTFYEQENGVYLASFQNHSTYNQLLGLLEKARISVTHSTTFKEWRRDASETKR